MGPDYDHTNILRKTPGLTNLFHSNVRRSRSLASLQREETEQQVAMQQAAMRSRTPLGAYNSFNESQTGLRPPPRTNKTVNSPDGHGVQMPKQRWFANPSLQEANARTPSPPSRPKPAPRLWTEDDDEPDIKPSLLGLESAGPTRPQPPQIMWQPPQPSTSPSSVYQQRDPRSPSPLTMMQSRRDRSLSRRRQPNVSELNLDPLSTVTETSNESPSFPNRPRSFRNLSDPTSTPGHAAGRESLTPRAKSTDDNAPTPLAAESTSTGLSVTPQASKRASSMLLPIALAPLITSSPPQLSHYTINSPEGEKPPVPPKDSIYAINPNKSTTPRPEQGSQSTSSSVSHSAQSSLSELDYTVASSVTTMSPIDLPNTWPVELPGKDEPLSPKSQHQRESQDPSGKLPWVMKEYKAMTARKPVGNAAPKTADPTQLSVENVEKLSNNVPMLATPTPPMHQRNVSDSVLNRGRPTRRGNQHRPQRTISRDLRLANIAGTIDDLPQGFNKVQALTTFSQEQLSSMRREADSDASSFEVLDQRNVVDMKEEQDLLDEHCNKLRRQALTLRETREQVHERLLMFLKTPGNALVSRDHIYKQTTELSDLDHKIDEAMTKLEAAQDRRVRVQRRLLEHVSATLALKIPGMGAAEEQTPPRSPTRSLNDVPTSIMIAMDTDDMLFSPPDESRHDDPAEAAADAERLDAEEWAYAERMQRERDDAERLEQDRQQEAERQQQELERELFRQQEERDSQGSKKASPKDVKKASPIEAKKSTMIPTRKESLMDASTKESPKKASSKKSSPQGTPTKKRESPVQEGDTLQMLPQQRYQPPGKKANAAAEKPEREPQSPPPSRPEPVSTPAAKDKHSPRNEIQSIQVYAHQDVYAGQQDDGMESLLSSIEQEIDAMEGQRSTVVY